MKFFLEDDIIMTQLDDDAVILNVKTGKYYSLNGSGLRMWELLQKHTETEDVFNAMLDEYEVDYNLLRHDFDNLIKKLEYSKLVRGLK